MAFVVPVVCNVIYALDVPIAHIKTNAVTKSALKPTKPEIRANEKSNHEDSYFLAQKLTSMTENRLSAETFGGELDPRPP